MSDPMPMIVPPLFWEWFNIWLVQFLKDLYHEIKMVGLRGGNNANSPYSQTCANHGIPSQHTGIDLTLNIPTSLTMAAPAGASHLNPSQINLQSLSTVSLQFVPSVPPINPGAHNHHCHSRSHNHSLNHSHGHGASHSLNQSINHTYSQASSLGLGGTHTHTNNLGLGGCHGHTNSLGLNVNNSHSNSLAPSGNHSHTNSVGVGGNHSQSLGVSVSLSHSNNHGISTSHSHNSKVGLAGNHSHTTRLGGIGAGHGHGTNMNMGGSHSHSTNHGLGGIHIHTSNLGIIGGQTNSLGLGGNHSHSSNLGLNVNHSHCHSKNVGVGGHHSHNSNLSLSGNHCHNSSLGLNGSSHSSNLVLGGNHSHGSNPGLGGNHCHTLNTGVGGSLSHGSNLNLGHSLASAVNSGYNQSNNHSFSSTQMSTKQNITSVQNVSSSQNPSITQPNLSKTTSHNQTHKIDLSRYTTSNCVLPSQAHQYRLLKQASRPVECYHPNGASAATYMSSSTGGGQSSGQATLRAQPTPPQPTAPPVPQQDISKTTMAGHNFVSQTQTPPRAQYQNFPQFRATQHGSRPNSHPRQQQPFIPGTASSTASVMFPTLVFQPHMGMQAYQQPRSGSPGFYQYHVGPYIGFSNPSGHTSPYYGYTANSAQLPTPSIGSSPSGVRSQPASLGPQGSPAAAATAPVSLAHSQPSAHLHQSMPGIRQAPVQQKRSHRLAIVDPVTQQDILSDLYPTSNEYFLSGEQNDRQTPLPEPPTHSIAEEFTRMVNEAVNQPSLENAIKTNFVPKNVETHVSSMSSTAQPQNAISSLSSINNNSILKSDLVNVNDNRSLGPDAAVAPCETPVVSAISDSPVIVPKMTLNVKPIQKIETTVLSNVDTSKNTQINMPTNKSSTLPTEKVGKEKDILSPSVTVVTTATVTFTSSPMFTTSTVPAPAPAIAPAPAPAPAPEIASAPTPAIAPAPAVDPVPAPAPSATPSFATAAPLPQRVPSARDRSHKSEEKDKHKIDKDIVTTPTKQNGPATAPLISSVDSLQQAVNSQASQNINQGATTKKQAKSIGPKDYATSPAPEQTLTATELLSASIEKVAREQSASEPVPEKKSSAFEAQAKLTQSISSVCRAQQSESKMKDINLNTKTTDPDTANGNVTEEAKSDTVVEDINKNEKSLKIPKNNSKNPAKMVNVDAIVKNDDSCENGKDETDKVVKLEEEVGSAQEEEDQSAPEEEVIEKIEDAPGPITPPVFVPKYKYTDEQWSPLNKSGKKCYDIGLLKQIKDDPLSKNKPDAPLLEACNVIRTAPMQEPMTFTPISRPVNDSLFPPFLKGGLGGPRTTPRDPKKDGRNNTIPGKGSVKLGTSPSNNSPHKPVIHVSLSLREDVKLREVDSAWKPTRFRKENIGEVDKQTQELYKKFRGILNKLTPQKFDTLLDKVQTLEIDNQKRLEGVIDLLFEKAIEEPNFSKAYALMCQKLSTIKVPSENEEKQFVNFRGLIISKCQNQFQTGKSDEQVKKYEKEIAESDDPARKKELQMMINEENRKVRMRAVANVRFIGELYKLKMLTNKIMDYCMRHLIEKLEEEKLECLCKLLTTIGEQFQSESAQSASFLDNTFKKMQEIVDRKSNKISSRVKFMIQDVIDLKRRGWIIKSVVDSQPKMMDQIQKEAEQQQRHIELMNASGGMGGGGGGGGSDSFRRDDGGRGKRGNDNRRQNTFMDKCNSFPRTRTPNYIEVKQKLKVVTHNVNNLNAIKLAPTHWNHGATGAKPQQAPAASNISITKNMYSVLENVQTDPTSIRGNRDSPTYHSKGASIERSTFTSKGEFSVSGSARSGSVGIARSVTPVAAEVPAATPAPIAPQEPLPDEKMKKAVKAAIALSLINLDDDELADEVKQLFPPQYHAAVIAEILNVVLEKAVKEVNIIAKSLFHLIATSTIAPENFVAGLKDTFEFAPDLLIDIPMLYDYIGKILTPHIEKKYITLEQIFELSDSIISANQGHLLLKSIIHHMNDSMGPTFVKSKWQESELKFSQWMSEELVPKWIADNKLEYLEGGPQSNEESVKILSPSETQSRLLLLMNSDQSCDCIKGWVQDKVGLASHEDWFMRALIQAICEHALYGAGMGAGGEARDQMHFSPERMGKYAALINEFGDSKPAREANCLFGIQHLLHRLEHPQGLALEIFQYLHEQYLISLDAFLAWGDSEKEPEGKAVMLKALTSFFTSIQEADNEESGSED